MQPIERARLPTAPELSMNVRHFLGYYMIKKLDVLNFLEETGAPRGIPSCSAIPFCLDQDETACLHPPGIYVEGLDTGDEDAQRVERRWLKPIYTAAPTVVYRYRFSCACLPCKECSTTLPLSRLQPMRSSAAFSNMNFWDLLHAQVPHVAL